MFRLSDAVVSSRRRHRLCIALIAVPHVPFGARAVLRQRNNSTVGRVWLRELGGKRFVVRLSDRVLLHSVQAQKVAEVFGQIPDGVDCELNPEVRSAWVFDRDL